MTENNKKQYNERVNIFKELGIPLAFTFGVWIFSFGCYFYANGVNETGRYNPIILGEYYSDLARRNLDLRREIPERNRKSNSLEGTVGEKFNIGE